MLSLFAAFNGALVGGALLAQERFGPVRTRLTLGGFLICVSILLSTFVLMDRGWVAYSARIGVATDALAILSAVLVFDYVRSSLSPRPTLNALYALPGLYLVGAIAVGGRVGGDELWFIVSLQIVFSAAAGAVYVFNRSSAPADWRRRPENLHLPLLLAGLVLVHLAQVLRLASPDNAFLYELVPLIGALGLLAFAIYAIMGSQTLRSLATPRPPAGPDDGVLAAMVDTAMSQTRAFLDPDLSLPKAAALVRTTPKRLSEHLNASRGVSFRAYVNSWRIAEAKKLLRSPAEARTSIDAIALLSGFRSRSSFYTAFKEQVGVSPGEFRTGDAPSEG